MTGIYKRSGYKVRPVVAAILKHPSLYTGQRMMKPPVVQVAGMHRALKRPVNTDSWSWIAELDGQRLFFPPNVVRLGRRPLARHVHAARALDRRELHGDALRAEDGDLGRPAAAQSGQARRPRARVLGDPDRDDQRAQGAAQVRVAALSDADSDWKRDDYPVLIVNALRMLVAVSPDYQTS